ncbi:fimbria/pilus chaperone family protein [Erwinia aphidicola]|uniref:fimbria/pilus chaperone family protein n=1 Tax=Erwinia aphidicola TaxID=68334 RepID=UPI0030D43A63
MSGSTFTVTHHAVSSETGRTADGNGSHGSTSKAPSYTKSVSWEHYPDDKEPQILVTQPVSRIAAGQTQRVRFILNQDKPLQHQHMKRVIFEGIPPQTASGANSIGMNIRQDLPVIIHPAALEMSADPWKALKWTQRGTTLTVTNPSDMVVRLAQEIELLPLRRKLKLSKSYILPGQSLNVTLPESAGVQSGRQVQIQMLSKYGYVAGKFKQPVSLAS